MFYLQWLYGRLLKIICVAVRNLFKVGIHPRSSFFFLNSICTEQYIQAEALRIALMNLQVHSKYEQIDTFENGKSKFPISD
jgi:hypothetical protein